MTRMTLRTRVPTRIIPRVALGLAGLSIVGIVAYAQPIAPPAGPINHVYKTLQEVEPRTPISSLPYAINQPGSYYLTRDLSGLVAQHGITINANNVTLDLRGFSLVGVPGSFSGVFVAAGGGQNLVVQNGTVRDWGAHGVDMFDSQNSQLRDLRAFTNIMDGLRCGGGCLVSGCTSLGNSGDGLEGQGAVTVAACTFSSNLGRGILATDNWAISGCTASYNTLDGIRVANGSTVSACTAGNNGGDGIHANFGNTITGCTARANTGDGIDVVSGNYVSANTCNANGAAGDGAGVNASGADNRIEGNLAAGNDRGIDCNPAIGNTIFRNSASGNTVQFDVAAGNDLGPIGTAAAAASPWANIAF